MTTRELLLPGLRPDPIQTYLAALGLLRSVSEQVDDGATLHLTSGGFVLRSPLDEDSLLDFLADDWAPTPLVSPWNKGSGLRPDGSAVSATKALAALAQGTDPRLNGLRSAVDVAQAVIASFPSDTNLEKVKDAILQRCRATLPDAALDWLDAAVILTTDGETYPLLLGTGGNLGRMDLTANAYTRLDDVIGLAEPADRDRSRGWAHDLVTDASTTPRVKGDSPGQFEPGGVGGVNSTMGDGGDSSVNPWGYLLALEGALLFASLPVRRLGAGRSFAAVPFSVRADGVGAAGVNDEEPLKGELWLPLWEMPATLRQLRRLFGEGRLQWGRSVADSAVDAARAIATLGADRGVSAFQRYSVAERLGQSTLVVPVERYVVRDRSDARVAATRSLDPWVNRLERLDNPPAAIVAGLRDYDTALLRLSRDEPNGALVVLEALAGLDIAIGRNTKLRGEISPLPWLDPARWLPALRSALRDSSAPEFDLSLGIASAYDHNLPTSVTADAIGRWPRAVSVALRHLDHQSVEQRVRPRWSDQPRLVGADAQTPVRALAAIHHARAAHATDPPDAEGAAGARGAVTRFTRGRWVGPQAVFALASGSIDEDLLGRLLAAMSLLDPRERWDGRSTSTSVQAATMEALVCRWLLAHQGTRVVHHRTDGSTPVVLSPGRDWPALLARGDVAGVVADARHRRRVAGLAALPAPLAPAGDTAFGSRLLAALLPAVSDRTALASLRTTLDPTVADSGDMTIPTPGDDDA